MLFPDSKREIYRKTPLKEVICQLRFPTILEIASKDPAEFQNRLRAAYPLYEKEGGEFMPKDILPKEVTHFLAQLQIPRPTETLIHKFLTEDSSRFISLSVEFLAVSEKKYTRWESFQENVEFARESFEEVYHPAFFSRIGLRYLNVLDRAELGLGSEPWESLINAAFIGLLGIKGIGCNVRNVHSEALIAVDEVPGGFLRLRHGLVKRGDENQAYLIDSDFFIKERRSSNDVGEIMAKFNRLAGNLFRWASTDHLRRALEPVPID